MCKDIPHYIALAGRFHMDHTPATRFTQQQMHELETRGETLWYTTGTCDSCLYNLLCRGPLGDDAFPESNYLFEGLMLISFAVSHFEQYRCRCFLHSLNVADAEALQMQVRRRQGAATHETND